MAKPRPGIAREPATCTAMPASAPPPPLGQVPAPRNHDFAGVSGFQYRARNLGDRRALALQGSLLLRHSDAAVADAFCASRLQSNGGMNYGNLPSGTDPASIIKRATPVVG